MALSFRFQKILIFPVDRCRNSVLSMLGIEVEMAAHRKYPWEVWFSQPRTVLVRGRDYDIDNLMMWQTIKNNASKYGVRVKVIDNDGGLILWTTVIDHNGKPAAPNGTSARTQARKVPS